MTAVEKIEARVKALQMVKSQRGAFYEDEEAEHNALANVLRWMENDRCESERTEAEALAAQQQEEDERRRNDQNAKMREMFKNVKIDVPQRKRG